MAASVPRRDWDSNRTAVRRENGKTALMAVGARVELVRMATEDQRKASSHLESQFQIHSLSIVEPARRYRCRVRGRRAVPMRVDSMPGHDRRSNLINQWSVLL